MRKCLSRTSSLRSLSASPFHGANSSFLGRTKPSLSSQFASRAKRRKEEANDIALDKERVGFRTMEEINKEFGKGTMRRLIDTPIKVPTVSTGLLSLDIALGGGIPKGRIIEIYGPEGSGKTTLALQMLSEAQKPNQPVAFFDMEYSLNTKYVQDIGIDLSTFYLTQPSSGDEAFNIMIKLIRQREVGAVCLDSVASLAPLAEMEASIEDSQVGLQARLMGKGIRGILQANASAPADRACTVIFVNQIRMRVGMLYGNPEVRPGGKALPFSASMCIEVRPSGKIDNGQGEVLGQKIKIKCVKNKVAPPFRVVELDLIYGEGICRVGSLLDAATQLGVIQQTGAYYSFDGSQLGHGRQKTVDVLKENQDLFDKISKETRSRYEEENGLKTQANAHEQPGDAGVEASVDGSKEEPITA